MEVFCNLPLQLTKSILCASGKVDVAEWLGRARRPITLVRPLAAEGSTTGVPQVVLLSLSAWGAVLVHKSTSKCPGGDGSSLEKVTISQ